MTEFGRLIQLWRTKRGLSLSGAAALIGCTKAHLWELEQGRSRNPTIRTIAGLAKAYDGSVPYMAHLAANSLFPAENGVSQSTEGSAREAPDDKKTISPPLRVGEAKSEGQCKSEEG